MGTNLTVVVLSREAFDALEFDAACSGDHRSAAQHMSRLADTGTATASMSRSEAYVRAGDQWLLADDPAAAAQGFMRALEDGGPASVDPRALLARALFMLGRAGDADALIHQLAVEPPRDARACDLLAELLLERGDLPGALAWATAGVEVCLGGSPEPVAGCQVPGQVAREPRNGHPPRVPKPLSLASDGQGAGGVPQPRRDDNELRLLLSLRFRVRNDLGLPEDSYDRMLDRLP